MRHAPVRALRLTVGEEDAGRRLRVAVAVGDTQAVDTPFGRAAAFVLYEVAPEACRLVGRVEFEVPSRRCEAANDNPDDCAPHLDARFAALAGCHVLFAQAFGDSAAARAMRSNIHPLVVRDGQPVTVLLARCQKMLAGNPPPWVRRILALPAGSKADAGASE